MATTPLMQQYHELKRRAADALLFFQVGDFFELFFDDAVTAAGILHITLTARGKNKGEPIPLCGVPVHAVQSYIARLLGSGKKVALAEQIEPARPGVVVKREITRIFTPGTITDEQLLDAQKPDYILSVALCEGVIQLVFAELLSAQMFATSLPLSDVQCVDYELARFYPQEVLVSVHTEKSELQRCIRSCGYALTPVAVDGGSSGNSGFGQWCAALAVKACNSKQASSFSDALELLYTHLQTVRVGNIDQLSNMYVYEPDEFLFLDSATQKNLELIRNSTTGNRSDTLVSVLDRAVTPMGSRMVQKWLLRPLRAKRAITKRLDAVALLYNDVVFHQSLKPLLQAMGDLERIVGRIGLRRTSKRDLHQLRKALQGVPEVLKILASRGQASELLAMLGTCLPDTHELYDFLLFAIGVDDSTEFLVASGYNAVLDHLRTVKHTVHKALLALEEKQQQITGISSLKIRYNRVQGYYIEVTNTHADRIPQEYSELQKLVGKRRYMNAELATLQQDIMRANNEIDQREKDLFEQIVQHVYMQLHDLRKLANTLAHIDALWSFAHIAYDNGYCKPIVDDAPGIVIVQGRHPVVEHVQQGTFVPNDSRLDATQRTMIITGPNMGGKSTYLRQSALIALMAHVGSFVPAESAKIGLLDRIFTRIGAGDNLSAGKSTFLVEMEETAHICNFATSRSLVILDEVGRGTSTHDGHSIARAVVDWLHNTLCSLTMFATHYHELSDLSEHYAGVFNMHAACSSSQQGIVFHHTIKPGSAAQSFGIDVARLAGLPESIIKAARKTIDMHTGTMPVVSSVEPKERNTDLRLEQLKEKLNKRVIDELSPRTALQLVWELADLLEQNG